jgi:hypothetical protein
VPGIWRVVGQVLPQRPDKMPGNRRHRPPIVRWPKIAQASAQAVQGQLRGQPVGARRQQIAELGAARRIRWRASAPGAAGLLHARLARISYPRHSLVAGWP